MSKAKERFDDRQVELVDLAQRILVSDGIPGFSIDRIAVDSGYSRPTIYQHFSSKADAITAVIKKTLEFSHSIMQRPDTFEGNPREKAFSRIVAFEQIARFHPDDFHINEFLGFPWVQGHVPEPMQVTYAKMIAAYFGSFLSALDESEAAGDIELPLSTPVRQVAFHTMVFIYGAFSSIVKKRVAVQLSGAPDPWKEARAALHSYWDGVGWKPLSTDYDYVVTYERILKGHFPEYWLKSKTEALAREVDLPIN